MKRFLGLLILLCPVIAYGQGTVAAGSRQVSSFLSGINTNDTVGCDANNNTSQTVYQLCYANLTLAGNSGLAVCTAGNSTATLAFSDDKTNTYTTLIGPIRHSGGQDLWMALASNMVTGTHQVTATFSASVTGIQCGVYELYHVTITSPSCGTAVSAQSAGNATVSAGSITSSVTNCIYVQISTVDTVLPASTQTVGSGWNWEDVDVRVGWALQTKINPTASAMTCSHTQTNADGWNTACVALKPDNAQGTAPSDMYVRNLAIFIQNDTTTSYTYQTPCSGNLIVWATNTGASQPVVNSVSHANPGTSFAQVGSGITGVEGVQQIFWDVQTWTNATTSTFTMSSTGNQNDVTYYCIVGAAAAGQPDSTLATGSGNCTSCSPLTGMTITPVSNKGLMIGTMGIAIGKSQSGTPQGTEDNQDNNNHWTHFTYTSTAAQAFAVTITGASSPGNWSMAGAAFKSATASGSLGNQFPRVYAY